MKIGDTVYILDINWSYPKYRILSAVVNNIVEQKSVFNSFFKFECKTSDKLYDLPEKYVFNTEQQAEASVKHLMHEYELYNFKR